MVKVVAIQITILFIPGFWAAFVIPAAAFRK